jgi:hypothetical protein
MKAPERTPHKITFDTLAKVLMPGEVTIHAANFLRQLKCLRLVRVVILSSRPLGVDITSFLAIRGVLAERIATHGAFVPRGAPLHAALGSDDHHIWPRGVQLWRSLYPIPSKTGWGKVTGVGKVIHPSKWV